MRIKAKTNDSNAWARALDAVVDFGADVNSTKTASMTAEATHGTGVSRWGRCEGFAAVDRWHSLLRWHPVLGVVHSYGTPIAVAVETASGPRWFAFAEFRSAHSVTTSRHQGTLRRAGVPEVRAEDFTRFLFADLSQVAAEIAAVLWSDGGMDLQEAAVAAVALSSEEVAS